MLFVDSSLETGNEATSMVPYRCDRSTSLCTWSTYGDVYTDGIRSSSGCIVSP